MAAGCPHGWPAVLFEAKEAMETFALFPLSNTPPGYKLVEAWEKLLLARRETEAGEHLAE